MVEREEVEADERAKEVEMEVEGLVLKASEGSRSEVVDAAFWVAKNGR